MANDDPAQARIDDLVARLERVRAIKHQMCNELMGAMGHAQLLSDHPGLDDKSRHRLERIREHCRNLTEQAEGLSKICRLVETTDEPES